MIAIFVIKLCTVEKPIVVPTADISSWGVKGCRDRMSISFKFHAGY